jgi:hypothetical protein
MRLRVITPAIVLALGFLQGCAEPPTLDVQVEEAAIRAMYAQRMEQLQRGTDAESKVAGYMSVMLC